MVATFQVRPPDQIHHITVIERVDDGSEQCRSLAMSLSRRQRGHRIEGQLIGPELVVDEEQCR
jgi:hypothetical protein